MLIQQNNNHTLEICTKKEFDFKQSASNIVLKDEIIAWLSVYKTRTRETYYWHIDALNKIGLLDVNQSLIDFSELKHNAIVDEIKYNFGLQNIKERTLQGRAAAYISLTRYLSRKYDGMVPIAIPNSSKTNKTFYSVSDKSTTNALSRSDWEKWLHELSLCNYRDYLIALVIIGGAKRVSEVLELTTDAIDFATQMICFRQLKTGGTEKHTYITYPKRVMELLKEYIGDRKGLVFITSGDKRVSKQQLHISFEKARKMSGIQVRIHPHVLRSSVITYLKEQGYSGDEIMKISGHSTIESVLYYDKTELRDNLSKRTSWV